MASSLLRAICWKCDRSFPSLRERKNHMANKDHGCLRVLCPFCRTERFFRRSSPELYDHCLKQHKLETDELPKAFFGESNGFWLARHPRDYIQLVDPTEKSSSIATKARELVRKHLSGSKELEAWESGWRLISEKKRARDPSIETESNFAPDYEEYSPERPAVEALEYVLGEVVTTHEGLEATIYSSCETVWYRVALHKTVCSSERAVASIFRRLRSPLPPSTPVTWTSVQLNHTMAKLISKSLGVNCEFVNTVMLGTREGLANPARKRAKTGDSAEDSRREESHRTTEKGDGQTADDQGVPKDCIGRPEAESWYQLVDSNPTTDVSDTSLAKSPGGISSQDVCLPVAPECVVPIVPTPSTLSSPRTPAKTISNNVTLLKWGAMPLFPPARRDWSRSVRISDGSNQFSWPPEGWIQYTPDQRLMAWEFAAMRLESPSLFRVPMCRGDLLDKYNFLALPGTQVPALDTPERKARYYNYETLRKGTSDAFVKQMTIAATMRDTSTDHLLDILDECDIPVRI